MPEYHIPIDPSRNLITHGVWTPRPSGPWPTGSKTAPRRSHERPSDELASAMRIGPPASLGANKGWDGVCRSALLFQAYDEKLGAALAEGMSLGPRG